MGYAVFAALGWMPDHRNYTKISSFYRQLYMFWRKLDGGRYLAPPKYYEDAAEEPLWGNHLIKDQSNRLILQPSLARCRFFNVKDIWTKQLPDARTVEAKFYSPVLHAIPQSCTSLPIKSPLPNIECHIGRHVSVSSAQPINHCYCQMEILVYCTDVSYLNTYIVHHARKKWRSYTDQLRANNGSQYGFSSKHDFFTMGHSMEISAAGSAN